MITEEEKSLISTPKKSTHNKSSLEKKENKKLKTLKILTKTNALFSILLFILAIGLLIDYVLYTEEVTRIPESCLSKGECNFIAFAASVNPPNLIYMRYKGFNQNYRDFVDSFYQQQFYEKETEDVKANEMCWPLVENSDLKLEKSDDGSKLDQHKVALPCGLLVNAYSGIDIDVRLGSKKTPVPLYSYKTSPNFYRDIFKLKKPKQSWLDFRNDNYFQNWVNPSITPDFRKFVGIIQEKIPPSRKIQISLKINDIKKAKLAGLSDFVVVNSGTFGQRYPFSCLISFLLSAFCFLFHEKGNKKIKFMESFL